MKHRFLICFPLVFSCQIFAATPEETASKILEISEVTGGLIVHLGSGDGKITAALRGENESIFVHGLEADAEKVKASRDAIHESGKYGLVSIEHFSGKNLPYLEGIVNLVVIEKAGEVSDDELMRILRPGGVALKRDGDSWKKSEKPWRDTIDDWTHFFHNAGGNAVAKDSEVGPPRHMKWVGSPKWSRHHDRMASMSALVSNGGRLFYIMDEGSRISIQLPPKWELVGRDAFNGVILWRRDIPEWHSHLWPLKSGPTQLARRLVATGDHVYATLGITAPVSMIDAVTGETTRTFEGSDGTEELIVDGETLYVIAMDGDHELADYLPERGTAGDQGIVAQRYKWNELPRKILAFNTTSGKKMWEKVSRVSPLTITASEGDFFFHDGDKVVALNGKSGAEMWTGGEVDRRDKVTFNFGPKLVVVGDKVLFAGGDRKMHTYEAKTGDEIWNAPHARGGYQSPEDLLVLKNTVWSAPLTSGKDSGTYTGRNLLTGEVEKEFSPNVDTYWFHHRCYIAKATENFLMPSRTGIEFVDPATENWDINHWVRGGCLYGVMPANGLTYAPPHNCACYPETKLYGFNALSSTGPRPDKDTKLANRLQKGPAFGKVEAAKPAATDWPTFRADEERSGFTEQSIAGKELNTDWEVDLGGRLSAIVSANGKLFVSQIDQHTLHAIDVKTGEPAWKFIAGGRVDSPPTIHNGAAIFGCADGNVYCLRASDGELVWKFHAAPSRERHMAFEQLESVWPVHGSVLVKNDNAYFVAGRSNFLDGGLRFYGLDVATGNVVSEKIIDEINPETGNNLQEKISTLQMPAGLPDILTSSGGYIYMRSQKMDLSGERLEIGPHSGDAATQGAVQREGEHLFAPMSFLDDTWFHRSYWVFGKSFAGGHNGYYQAGKNTPSGRILVFNDKDVFGFGRKPEYLKWTTTLEHQLFSASRNAPEGALTAVDDADVRRGKSAQKKGAKTKGKGKKQGAQFGSFVDFGSTKTLSPIGKPLGVEAWVKLDGGEATVIAHGGPTVGYALTLRKGIPRFIYRNDPEKLPGAVAKKPIPMGEWTHLIGQITADKQLQLFINGELAATGKADGFIGQEPAQGLQIGSDTGSPVGAYNSPLPLKGLIDEVSVFHGMLSAEEVAERFKNPGETGQPENASIVLYTDFDKGDAADFSGNSNSGQLVGVKKVAEGKSGGALEFTGKSAAYGGGKQGGSLVKPYWTQDIPLLARAMVLADKTLFVAGPPDLFNEVETFEKLAANDESVQKVLAEQDAAMAGAQGSILRAFSAETGETISELKLPALPIWDGMSAADGKLLLSTKDGRVMAISGK